MKTIRKLKYFILFAGFLILSFISFQGCRQDKTDVENNGELCDTCVIVLAPDIPGIKNSSAVTIKKSDF
jgi:hypothetical protein